MDISAMKFGEIARSLGGPQTNYYGRQATGSNLDMNSFLRLLAAQFANQDMMNPTDNTQFISELAQFSSLQAMSAMTQTATKQYAASLVGQTVKLSAFDSSGKAVKKTGTVQGVTFTNNGGAALMVDGTAYDIGSVIQVIDPKNPPPAQDNPADGGGAGGGGANPANGSNDASGGTNPTNGTSEEKTGT